MSKQKILIIGGTGMLGHVLYYYLEKLDKYKLYNAVYRTKLTQDSFICDVTNKTEVEELFKKIKPDVVINCVGALVQESNENPANAIYLNALFPYLLKDLCDVHQSKLIHISTDCVFSGKKGDYLENDSKDAEDIYGRSKSLGEIFDSPHCTLRTSIIGPELKKNGTGLFHWFMEQEEEVKGYSKAMWGGVTTLQLAKAIESTMENNLQGLYHVTNGTSISKFKLLTLINDVFRTNNPISIKTDDSYVIDKSLRKSEKFDFKVPTYDQMLIEMFENTDQK